MDVIERSIDNITRKSKVTLINGQLISDTYMDQIMEEIYELVSERGSLLIQELTTRYNLPLEFLKETI